tara:strand:+ start:561 stop:704 length:144 start_codon:yes stop_codon:yes gene_type:complete
MSGGGVADMRQGKAARSERLTCRIRQRAKTEEAKEAVAFFLYFVSSP